MYVQIPDESCIYVSGCSGFVGLNVLKELLSIQSDKQMKILVSSRDYVKLPSFLKLTGTVTESKQDILLGEKPAGAVTHIVHMAHPRFTEESDVEYRRNLLLAMNWAENIAKFIDASKSPIRLMYLSSGGVYGTKVNLGKHIPISENFTSPLGVNLTNYSKVKVHVEKYFYSKIPLSNFINPRLFTFYGDFLPLTRNFLIGNLMNSVLMKEEINLKSNGHTIRSYMHSAQMARSLVFLLYSSFSGVINVGSDVEIDVKSLAQLFSHLFGLNYELSPQPNHETYYVPNIDLLKNLAPNLVYSNFEERLLQWYSDLTSTEPRFFSF